jgi:dihydrofolate reductase
MTLSIVVAVANNHVIGKKGALPWHLPGDLKHFKELTMGQTLIMGRKTQEAIGRVLPGRKHIIISANPDYAFEGATVVDSIEKAVAAAADEKEAFVIGGGQVYQQAIDKDLADLAYVTRVHGTFDGDTYFYPLDATKWELVSARKVAADKDNAYAFTLETHIRKRK